MNYKENIYSSPFAAGQEEIKETLSLFFQLYYLGCGIQLF